MFFRRDMTTTITKFPLNMHQTLKIAPNLKIMLLYNYDVSDGLCNGRFGIVKEIRKETISVNFGIKNHLIKKD